MKSKSKQLEQNLSKIEGSTAADWVDKQGVMELFLSAAAPSSNIAVKISFPAHDSAARYSTTSLVSSKTAKPPPTASVSGANRT